MGKAKNRFKSGFGRSAFVVGITAVILSRIVYTYISNDWLYQANQEILGFGLISIIAGIFYVFFGRKTNI